MRPHHAVHPLLAAALLASLGCAAREPSPRERPRQAAPPSNAPSSSVSLSLTSEALGPDAARVTVTARASQPLAALTLGLELQGNLSLTEGAPERTVRPLRAGEAVVLRASVRRAQPGPQGVELRAWARGEHPAGSDGDERSIWLFGPPPTARRAAPSTSLGPEGTGALGQGERVVRTPTGTRLHETLVP